MATQFMDFCGVLSESKRIIKAHSRHFLALSVVFLLPIAFSLIAFPTLHLLITKFDTNPTETLIRYSPHQYRIGLKTLSISLLYAFIVLTFFLCATGTITYSIYQGLFGRPVKFISAIKSLANSLLRLFVTVLCVKSIILAILFLVGLFVYLVIMSVEFLGFQLSYSWPCFTIVYVIGLVGLGLGLMYLQVNWVLVCVIVVVESSWGFEPLRRSTYLVRGTRGVAVFLLLFFGGFMAVISQGCMELTLASGIWTELLLVLQIVFLSSCVMVMLLNSVAANTVLYMHCKALHGELALEIAEEFAREYASLPFDGEKVPPVVSVIQP